MRQLLPMAPCWAMCHRTHNVALSRRHRVCSDGESLQSHTITLLCVRRGHIEGGVSGFKVEGARPSLADLVEGGIDRQRHRRGLENNSTQLLCRERTLNQRGLVAVLPYQEPKLQSSLTTQAGTISTQQRISSGTNTWEEHCQRCVATVTDGASSFMTPSAD